MVPNSGSQNWGPFVILIAGIFPRASSNGAHGSQSDDSTYLALIYAVVFTSPLTSRLCSQLQELQELPTSPLRMWSSSKKHHLLLTWAPGPGVEPKSRGHEADALPLSYPHILSLIGVHKSGSQNQGPKIGVPKSGFQNLGPKIGVPKSGPQNQGPKIGVPKLESQNWSSKIVVPNSGSQNWGP